MNVAPSHSENETIFALSSGALPAGIAVMRISGPQSIDALRKIAGKVPTDRFAAYTVFKRPETGEILDRGLALVFPKSGSVTGEDLVELHLHGSRAVVTAVEGTLRALPGLRPALPGEFTRRAFENGRLDLAEAEGLADLLSAETESQRRNAILLTDGLLSRRIKGWIDRLTRVAALIEAQIDYADEDDVGELPQKIWDEITSVSQDMRELLAAPSAERLKDGIRVTLAGPPNAGKSTLINRLVGREVAITTPIPGTTRDLLEASVDINGIAYVFTDSAGIRESADIVEQIGVDRARTAVASADIVIWLGPPSEAPENAICVQNFSDRDDPPMPGVDVRISALTGQSISELQNLVEKRALTLLPREGEVALGRRQRGDIQSAFSMLANTDRETDILIVAESLRAARSALSEALGIDGGVEATLDALFGQFCIGK